MLLRKMRNVTQGIRMLIVTNKTLNLQVPYRRLFSTVKQTFAVPDRNTNHISEFKEIKIPVPWGYITGKWWGNPDVQPVLALHGVQDNAATFDKLAPLLNVDALLAIDLPGHGWSSHIPEGFGYDFMDGVCYIRLIIKQLFKWDQPMVLLGHSFGSFLSLVYSAIFPEEVSKFISIDCARHQMIVQPNTIVSDLRNTMDKIISLEGKKPPEYTYEELLQNFYEGRKKLINKEACEILLSRGMSKHGNGKVYLSRDVRIKLNAFGRLTGSVMLDLAALVKCDHLSIQFSNGTVKDNPKGELYKRSVEIILKNSSRNKHVVIEGNHHNHLEYPVPVANAINEFLVQN